jgi:hypothetical protein
MEYFVRGLEQAIDGLCLRGADAGEGPSSPSIPAQTPEGSHRASVVAWATALVASLRVREVHRRHA